MFVPINRDNPAPYDLMWSKNVGQTRAYNSAGGLHAAAYTSMDGMVAGNGSSTSSFAQMSRTHSANDPLCTAFLGRGNDAPPIWYSEKVRFYRSGSTKVEGNLRAAPTTKCSGEHMSACRLIFDGVAGGDRIGAASRGGLQSRPDAI